jgi:P-type conjugative transfer ATPase TrbB
MSAGAIPFVPGARRRAVLAAALGPEVAAALNAPEVTEALINADGRLWLDRAGSGLEATSVVIPAADREAAVRLLAHEAGETVGPDRPLLSAVLPGSAARVQAVLPPLVAAPVLAIRKRPERIFTLDDYVASGAATEAQAEELRAAIRDRRNIIVAGGAGSGKTTLLNALLAEPAFRAARTLVLEDTAELQVSGENVVQLLTKRAGAPVTLRDLVQTALRLRPDRIIVGEVRDAAALDVLKAWNTGHPGGLLTLHANSAADALGRLEDLCLEAGSGDPSRLIAQGVQLIVFIERMAEGRRISQILTPNPHQPVSKGDLT